MNYQTAIVVGGTTGIGRELVRQLSEGGCRVAVLGRSEAPNVGEAIFRQHDVTEPGDVPALIADLSRELQGLDVFIYASGIMTEVRPSEFDSAKDHEIFAVNLLGAVSWLNAIAERMQATGAGTIVVIGSLAGERGRTGQPAYNASKAGLHSFTESLRNRLAPLGVRVTTIKPGPVATPRIRELGMKSAMPVEKAARRILASAGKGKDVYLKLSERAIFSVIRLLPSWIMRRLPI